MSFTKRFSIIGLLIVFLVGNIGLGIFTHTCATSGVEKSFFVQGEDPCDDHHEEIAKKSCCHESCEPVQEVHEDCCSTDVEYVHLSVDQRTTNEQVSAFIITPFAETQVVELANSTFEPRTEVHFQTNPPPKLQGRKLHKLNQIFVI